MDIYKAIHELMQEKKRLDAVIASLESRSSTVSREKRRRGRKSMSPEERAVVSRRMAAYWAVRRGQVEVANQPADAASLAEMPPVAQLVRAAAASFEASL
jgi:hypothetical protein